MSEKEASCTVTGVPLGAAVIDIAGAADINVVDACSFTLLSLARRIVCVNVAKGRRAFLTKLVDVTSSSLALSRQRVLGEGNRDNDSSA